MKKKLLSILASVIVVLTACICLVGCTKVTQANLEQYMKDFVNSTNKAIHVEDDLYNGTGSYSFVQLYNNKMYFLYNEKENTGKRVRTYYEYEQDKNRIIKYVGTKANKSDKAEEKWEVTVEEGVAKTDPKADFKASFNSMIDPKTGYDAASKNFTLDYTASFTVDGKWIVANNDCIASGCAFKIESKVLRINYQYHEKDDKGNSKKEFHNARLIMNYGEVKIPDEATSKAIELGIKSKK